MTELRTSDFDYELPPELIAQTPIEPRDQARLLVVRRDRGAPSAGSFGSAQDRSGQWLEHRRFYELPELLRAGDLLVMNESRVIPARLLGHKVGPSAAPSPPGGEGGVRVRATLFATHPPPSSFGSAQDRSSPLPPGEGEQDAKPVEPRSGQAASAGSGQALQQAQDGAAIEVLLLRPVLSAVEGEREPGLWEALVRRARRLKVGDRIAFGPEGELTATLEDVLPSGARLIRLSDPAAWERLGQVPLPPYIHVPLSDPERYQTVYAREKGSVAAPTAGLHFTPALLERLRARGIELAFLTLHVSWDTFRPVTEDDPGRHKLMREWCSIPAETVARLRAARREGRRIVAVGTTACRALEWAAERVLEGRSALPSTRSASSFDFAQDRSGRAGSGRTEGQGAEPIEGWADLLILPGHRFRLADALITNFHLPRSTLLMLVSAFASCGPECAEGSATSPSERRAHPTGSGRELVLRAYREAVRERYRFYSFGDAMLIV